MMDNKIHMAFVATIMALAAAASPPSAADLSSDLRRSPYLRLG